VALADSLQGRTTNAAVAFWVARRMHCGFFGSRSNEFRSEDSLDFMNINNMSLGTIDPLHVYVKHDVELKRLQKAMAPSTLFA
jgi:hypothetical protein